MAHFTQTKNVKASPEKDYSPGNEKVPQHKQMAMGKSGQKAVPAISSPFKSSGKTA